MNWLITYRKPTWLILCLFCLFYAADTNADEGASNLSARSEELAQQWVHGWINQEKAEIIGTLQGLDGTELSAPNSGDDPTISRLLMQPVEESLDLIRSRLETHISELDAEIESNTKAWIRLRALQIERGQERAAIEGATSTFGLLAHLFDSRNRWIWFCALIATLCLAGAILHDRRHDFRKRFFGTRAKSLRIVLVTKIFTTTLAIFTIVVFLFGGTIHSYLISKGSGATVDSLSKVAEEIKGFPVAPNGYDLPKPNSDVKGITVTPDENKLRREIQLTRVKNKLLVSMYTTMSEHGVKLEAANKYLSNNASARNSTDFWGRVVRFLISALLLGGIGYIAISLKRLIRKRNKINGETCPSCMGEGSLVGADSVGEGVVRCNNMVQDPDYPDEDQECGFEIRSIYKQMPKLCFPTLGHVYAGKTHWLAMTYRELSNSRFDADLNFARIQGAKTEDFDQLVDDLIENRQGTGATQVEYVDPLLFHFTDKDRYGKTDVLLNMFDYSGEVTLSRTIEDPLRRRALDADGYVFFLDPTLPAEPQAKALNDFAEDVKTIKGVDRGRTIQVPVAICVSKIDLMCMQPYADPSGGGIIGEFYREVSELDPNGNEYSMNNIDAFSEMMERYVSTIWPGWNINQAIDRLFDGRFRYFPLSPVGLNALGTDDLENIAQVPYRVLHPLLWLLQMNGYQVLDKRSVKKK
jgi:hypothetical protein